MPKYRHDEKIDLYKQTSILNVNLPSSGSWSIMILNVNHIKPTNEHLSTHLNILKYHPPETKELTKENKHDFHNQSHQITLKLLAFQF